MDLGDVGTKTFRPNFEKKIEGYVDFKNFGI